MGKSNPFFSIVLLGIVSGVWAMEPVEDLDIIEKITLAASTNANYWNEPFREREFGPFRPRWWYKVFWYPENKDDKWLKAFLATELIDLEALDEEGWTALLFRAPCFGEGSEFETLLNAGANVDAEDVNGQTALMLANGWESSSFACIESVSGPQKRRLLMNAGANISKRNHNGQTALMKVAQEGDLGSCSAIITHSRFSPRPTKEEKLESQARIWATLLCFKRVFPAMPRDLRRLVVGCDAQLLRDALNCPMGLCKDLPHLMPLEMVKSLISSYVLTVPQAVNQLKKYKMEQLKPLVQEAVNATQDAIIKTMIDPEKLDRYYGTEIERVLKDSLGIQETHSPVVPDNSEKVGSGSGWLANCSVQ